MIHKFFTLSPFDLEFSRFHYLDEIVMIILVQGTKIIYSFSFVKRMKPLI